MINLISFLTYNNPKLFNVKLSEIYDCDKLIYFTDGSNSVTSFDKDKTNFISYPRNPIIETLNCYNSGDIGSKYEFSLTKDNIDNLNRVISRYNSLLKKEITKTYSVESLLIYCTNIIRKYQINMVIFGDWPHTPIEYTTYLISNLIGLKTIVIRNLPHNHYDGSEKLIITSKFPSLERCNPTNNINLNLQSEKVIKSKFELEPFVYSKYHLGVNIGIKQKIKYRLRKKGEENNNLTLVEALSRLFNYVLKVYIINKVMMNFISQNAEKHESLPITNQKYVYFPLHFQPEASTIPWGNNNYDQLELIRYVSKILPQDMMIYVKEHPAYWTRNTLDDISKYRNSNFYNTLCANPKVKLINHSYPTLDLIKNSEFTMTVTGSVAWESLIHGKNCLHFGDSIYNDFPNVIKLDTKKEFDKKTDFIKLLEKPSNILVNSFLNCINSFSVEFNRFQLRDMDEYDGLKLELLIKTKHLLL